DLNQIEGKYPIRAEPPATPGFEGAGVVIDLGANVTNLTAGALVILPHNVGTWREAVAVKADELVVVPAGIEPVHAAMLKIHPMTAWRLLHDYVQLQKGDWLIQNAANSFLKLDRKSTRLNSSHRTISYAVSCLNKKLRRKK